MRGADRDPEQNLVLFVNGKPKVVVPDHEFELDTGEPITTEMLGYGHKLAVIGIPA